MPGVPGALCLCHSYAFSYSEIFGDICQLDFASFISLRVIGELHCVCNTWRIFGVVLKAMFLLTF